jgi:NAD(P)-dependent dehydrogenase (short-subunit alcohol dehydrogenase family)
MGRAGAWTWNGCIVIVTGAASGIGFELARQLLAAGAQVWAVDRNEDGLRPLAEAGASTRQLDVTDPQAWFELIASVPTDRPLALFANAGIAVAGAFESTTVDDWNRLLNVNVMGVVHGVRAVLPHMRRLQGGRIIVTSSGAGLFARPGMSGYAASKHAVTGLCRALSAELAVDCIAVTAVCPGYIGTGIMDRTAWRGVDGDAMQRAIPIRPVSSAECAARMIRAAQSGSPLLLVGNELKLESWLNRLSPSLARMIARLRAQAFRKHRR